MSKMLTSITIFESSLLLIILRLFMRKPLLVSIQWGLWRNPSIYLAKITFESLSHTYKCDWLDQAFTKKPDLTRFEMATSQTRLFHFPNANQIPVKYKNL